MPVLNSNLVPWVNDFPIRFVRESMQEARTYVDGHRGLVVVLAPREGRSGDCGAEQTLPLEICRGTTHVTKRRSGLSLSA